MALSCELLEEIHWDRFEYLPRLFFFSNQKSDSGALINDARDRNYVISEGSAADNANLIWKFMRELRTGDHILIGQGGDIVRAIACAIATVYGASPNNTYDPENLDYPPDCNIVPWNGYYHRRRVTFLNPERYEANQLYKRTYKSYNKTYTKAIYTLKDDFRLI